MQYKKCALIWTTSVSLNQGNNCLVIAESAVHTLQLNFTARLCSPASPVSSQEVVQQHRMRCGVDIHPSHLHHDSTTLHRSSALPQSCIHATVCQRYCFGTFFVKNTYIRKYLHGAQWTQKYSGLCLCLYYKPCQPPSHPHTQHIGFYQVATK